MCAVRGMGLVPVVQPDGLALPASLSEERQARPRSVDGERGIPTFGRPWGLLSGRAAAALSSIYLGIWLLLHEIFPASDPCRVVALRSLLLLLLLSIQLLLLLPSCATSPLLHPFLSPTV